MCWPFRRFCGCPLCSRCRVTEQTTRRRRAGRQAARRPEARTPDQWPTARRPGTPPSPIGSGHTETRCSNGRRALVAGRDSRSGSAARPRRTSFHHEWDGCARSSLSLSTPRRCLPCPSARRRPRESSPPHTSLAWSRIGPSRGGRPGGLFPHGQVLPSVPRAAYSHSSSVGSRFPTHPQYAFAWFQFTQLIGWLSL